MDRKRVFMKFVFYNGALLLATALYAVAFKLAEASDSDLFACHFLENVGIYCVACGGSRSLIYLLDFKFLKSFIYYPPLIFTLTLIIIVDILTLLALIKNDRKYLGFARAEVFISVPVVMIINFFARTVLLFFGVDFIGDVL